MVWISIFCPSAHSISRLACSPPVELPAVVSESSTSGAVVDFHGRRLAAEGAFGVRRLDCDFGGQAFLFDASSIVLARVAVAHSSVPAAPTLSAAFVRPHCCCEDRACAALRSHILSLPPLLSLLLSGVVGSAWASPLSFEAFRCRGAGQFAGTAPVGKGAQPSTGWLAVFLTLPTTMLWAVGMIRDRSGGVSLR